MRILHLISSLDPRDGGPVEAVRQFRQASAGHGVESEIACCDAPGAVWLAANDADVHPLGPSRPAYHYAPRLVPWLRENRPRFDAVIVHGIWQYHGLAAWRALAGEGVPYFVYVHGMLDPWFRRTYPVKHLKKWLYWPWAGYRLLRDARAVLFTCEEERRLARQSFTLYKARERIAGLGVAPPPEEAEAQLAAFRQAFPRLADKRLLLFMGRLDPKKGCDLLIEAFAAVAARDPALELVIAGPDPQGWRASLETRAQRLSVSSRITWTGMVSGALKWGSLRAAEALCLTSHQENFGLVAAEALACGRPVLLSRRVNIWREITDAGAGFAEEDTQEGTRALLERWLALAPEQRRAMGERAWRCFQEKLALDQAAAGLLRLIAEETEGCDDRTNR